MQIQGGSARKVRDEAVDCSGGRVGEGCCASCICQMPNGNWGAGGEGQALDAPSAKSTAGQLPDGTVIGLLGETITTGLQRAVYCLTLLFRPSLQFSS